MRRRMTLALVTGGIALAALIGAVAAAPTVRRAVARPDRAAAGLRRAGQRQASDRDHQGVLPGADSGRTDRPPGGRPNGGCEPGSDEHVGRNRLHRISGQVDRRLLRQSRCHRTRTGDPDHVHDLRHPAHTDVADDPVRWTGARGLLATADEQDRPQRCRGSDLREHRGRPRPRMTAAGSGSLSNRAPDPHRTLTVHPSIPHDRSPE